MGWYLSQEGERPEGPIPLTVHHPPTSADAVPVASGPCSGPAAGPRRPAFQDPPPQARPAQAHQPPTAASSPGPAAAQPLPAAPAGPPASSPAPAAPADEGAGVSPADARQGGVAEVTEALLQATQ